MSVAQNTIDELAKKIWDYHHLNHPLKKADCILVLGSHDTSVAERGTQLFLDGWAPLLIFSGGLGNLTKEVWTRPEAEIFADIALRMGVPRENILIENKSTNTGENILFAKRLLEARGMNPQKFIAVQKPYMERRTFATFVKIWPGKELVVTSPQLSFEEYTSDGIPKDDVIHIMVGDLQRIKEYPAKGFQIYQEIPADVWRVYEELVKLGYTKHLIQGT